MWIANFQSKVLTAEDTCSGPYGYKGQDRAEKNRGKQGGKTQMQLNRCGFSFLVYHLGVT